MATGTEHGVRSLVVVTKVALGADPQPFADFIRDAAPRFGQVVVFTSVRHNRVKIVDDAQGGALP